ncbi:hypothetical protein ACFVS9_32705 [Streptomyces sp. NPDC058008]|uniref:hypothetical protein n=1 Tax=Streptomyces sp. NPDC058008 TaxID=3346303 RepID=UPI0036E52C2B
MFKRAAVLSATVLAFSGAAIGVSQAATQYETEVPGTIATDCNKNSLGQGDNVVIVFCEQQDVAAGSTPTITIYWRYA